MTIESAIVSVAGALLPVLLFLGLLVLLDSFKLVAPRSVLIALVAGAIAALAGAQLNAWLFDATQMSPVLFSRYAAPFTEEGLKALWVVILLRRGRVGFLVDAAILGFAVGAGFRALEHRGDRAARGGPSGPCPCSGAPASVSCGPPRSSASPSARASRSSRTSSTSGRSP